MHGPANINVYLFYTQVYLAHKLTFRLVVMLAASTSNWSEIRLPIIRAYLGCKHRSSSKINSRRPRPLFDLRQIAIGRRKKKSHNATSPKSVSRISPIHNSQKEACHNAHTRTKYFSLSLIQRYLLKTAKDIVAPTSGHSKLAAVSSRRNDFLLDGAFPSPPLPRLPVLLSKIVGRSVYE